MAMSYTNRHWLNQIDRFCAENYVRLRGERAGCLTTFLFHGLFRNLSESRNQVCDVQQGITVKHFEDFINYFLSQGYVFVGQEDIRQGLNPFKKYALITFDDGYYNNVYAVDVLKKFRVPAVFFISVSHVLEQKSFWWDAIFRERSKEGVSRERITREQNLLKTKKNHEIENYVIEHFGGKALSPVSDVDRPLTADELKHLSRQPFVEIGNHTYDHAILTNYSAEEIKEEMLKAQTAIKDLTGISPAAISYPNGNSSPESIAAAKDLGFKIGITTVEGKNYLPMNPNSDAWFCLKRFTLWGNDRFLNECVRARSDFQLKSSLRKIIGKS